MSKRKLRKQPRDASIGIASEESTWNPRKKYVLVTEGKVTEPDYFRYAIADLIDDDHNTVSIEDQHNGDYKRLVAIADNAERNSSRGETEYWILADTEQRDVSTECNDLLDWARESGHYLALSNTMFEVWVLMHKQKPNTNSAAKSFLIEQMRSTVVRTYSATNKHLDKVTFAEEEVRRAIQLAGNRRNTFQTGSDKQPPNSPWNTTVDLLVKKLLR